MKPEYLAWLVQAEPGWEPASLPFLALKDTFVSGDSSARRLLVKYYRCQQEAGLCAKILFGPEAQGPPGHAHGGGMAAILDESMGGVAWLAGYPVVAAQLNVTFGNMLPVETPALVRAEITSVIGRKVYTKATLTDRERDIEYCRSTGLFIALDEKQVASMPHEAAEIVAKALASSQPNRNLRTDPQP